MPNLDIGRRRSSPRYPGKQIQKPISPPSAPVPTERKPAPPPRPKAQLKLPKLSLPKVKMPKIPWKTVLAATLGVAVIAVWVFMYLPTAVITVEARSEPVTRDFDLQVDGEQSEPSSELLAVPASVAIREISGNKTAQASGTRNIGKTASGFVTIYNFSKTTLILKAQTTELTANGRTYRFTQDVGGIRPTAKIGLEDAEIDETSLIPPVPIIAAQAGEQFNLPAGTRLEISNEAFGTQPEVLYASVGDGVITGGSTTLIKVVTETDIDNAMTELADELIEQGRAEIVGGSPGSVIADGAIDAEILDRFSETKSGAEKDEFEVSVRVRLGALSYNQEHVRDVILQRVTRLLPENKKLADDTISIDSRLTIVNISQAQARLEAHFEGRVQYVLDFDELKEKVRGKSAEEIREIFLSRPEIESMTVEFSPFWVKKAPKMRDRIRLDGGL